jgi:hypothetical protein
MAIITSLGMKETVKIEPLLSAAWNFTSDGLPIQSCKCPQTRCKTLSLPKVSNLLILFEASLKIIHHA